MKSDTQLARGAALQGRELDALIAHRLFGWRWFKRLNVNDDIRHALFPPIGAGWTRFNFYPDFVESHEWPDDSARFSDWYASAGSEDRTAMGLPRYSSSIEAAFQVVEKMRERGFWLKLTSPFEPGDVWNAGFTIQGFTGWNGRPDHRAQGDTAALAISLAALAALEREQAPEESGDMGRG